MQLHCLKLSILDCANFGQERFLGPEKQMKIGLAQRRVMRGTAFLSVLWWFCSAAIASDAQTYQTAAAVAVS
ncbi:hypothetical protein BSZ22_24380 [Bradyrhizobium canariense]|uniref:Uncharacterized protein n=1 Tax=Bradyrhizobium canariense TaxID=255045 RepID=A0A1X3H263_9BRAD|nr:hypothetical protein BSZ22_24380 [Bradyrhizobium canariense]OSI77469.1 hypothetical protein BSZ23_22440 [Bradyrhizobium canariense]OSI87360.1 hypothetical protein BSZ24_27855 [Bradyrhizobium canariense]OSI88555.1 hypothetical protein BSZ25_23910 [Bradyrhizobium canariense]OSJ00948.1 hypothetical protein BSZ16_22580 [Bradyrhizobium canariense]